MRRKKPKAPFSSRFVFCTKIPDMLLINSTLCRLLTEIGHLPFLLFQRWIGWVGTNACFFGVLIKNFKPDAYHRYPNVKQIMNPCSFCLKEWYAAIIFLCAYWHLFSWMTSKVKISYSKCSFGIFTTSCQVNGTQFIHPVSWLHQGLWLPQWWESWLGCTAIVFYLSDNFWV